MVTPQETPARTLSAQGKEESSKDLAEVLTRGIPAAAGLSGRCHDGDGLRLDLPGGGDSPPGSALGPSRSAALLCPSMLLLLLLLPPVLEVRMRLLLLALLWRPAGCLVGLHAQAAHLCLHTQEQRNCHNSLVMAGMCVASEQTPSHLGLHLGILTNCTFKTSTVHLFIQI